MSPDKCKTTLTIINFHLNAYFLTFKMTLSVQSMILDIIEI
uniref:Uncharacterized protein n=1 Tax=Arundo donax TaxID=35708 RepID=A0A0A9A1F2_ARUDO